VKAETLLSVFEVSKAFPGVQALSSASFDLRAGEVHALVGENGAGKSTLARIISGLERPDSGEMRLDGSRYAPSSKMDAGAKGIRMVMQELDLIETLTIAENIFLNDLPARLGLVRRSTLNMKAKELMDRIGLGDLDPASPVERLGVGQQQMVEIAAALSRECRILILDEPTASLTDAERDLLFEQMGKLRESGSGIIYISHRMEEIRRIADRVTVLRDGKHIATRPTTELGVDEIIRLMVGRDLVESCPRPTRGTGEVALQVRGLCRGERVRGVSFEAYRGEILGFAGLMGSGRTETMRAIFAADRPAKGDIYLYGSDTAAVIRSPRDAVRNGIALLTEDRKAQGLFLPLSVRANVTLTRLSDLARVGWIDTSRETCIAKRLTDRLSLRCSSTEQPVNELSGGNQQKVVVAKWLCREADILIFDEPTRGIDVGARFEIYRLLADLTDEGKAIIVVSSDLLELMAICDRIAVMSLGRLARIFGRGEWTQDEIMAAALSEHIGTSESGSQRP